jgi:ribonuclease BN (tRNA processing enzyme)
MHPDHFFDLVPLRYGLKYGRPPNAPRMPLWLPPRGTEALAALRRVTGGEEHRDFFDGVFFVREYEPARPLTIGDLRLTFRRTRHYVEAFAIRAECDGESVTYSADTAPCDAVVEHARESGVFLCEAALGLNGEEGERGHTTAREAGEMASSAHVGRLVLTHYPASFAVDDLVAAAQERFCGPVTAASDGLEVAATCP